MAVRMHVGLHTRDPNIIMTIVILSLNLSASSFGFSCMTSTSTYQSSSFGSSRSIFGEQLYLQPLVSNSYSKIEMMRHQKGLKKLNKPADQRKALLRSLTTEVLRYGRIKTLLMRAKVVRSKVDKMIGLAKRGTLHARRQAMAYIYDKNLVRMLFEKAPERYGKRDGGYTRVLHTMARRGDNTKMAIIELVESDADKCQTPAPVREKLDHKRVINLHDFMYVDDVDDET